MGNNCVGARDSKNGFIQSISNSILWTTSNCLLTHNSKEITSREPSLNNDQSEATLPVQDKPPVQLKIVKEETNPEKHKETVQPQKLNEGAKPDSHGEETRMAQPVSQKVDVKLAEPEEKKKPHNVKRLASAGLRAESVLQTKTGHLKEYYNLGRKLGHGQFGTTFLCVERATGKEYACKSIAKRKLLSHEDVEDVRREIQILHHISGNPNVISIKGAYEDAVAVHVVMELCSGGELFDRIIKKGHYTERKAAQLMKTIVGVIEDCHSLGVMHRDLKPENFLFVNDQEDSPLKAIDFGLSVFFKPGLSKTFLFLPINICGLCYVCMYPVMHIASSIWLNTSLK